MNFLSNMALLVMVEGWQIGIKYTGRNNAEAHPHYQDLLDELILRGMVLRWFPHLYSNGNENNTRVDD